MSEPLADSAAPVAITGDRWNPILVRVVRQELRSKAFISIFILLLTGATVTAMVVAALSRDSGVNNEIGPGFFGVIAFAWVFALGVAQPLACFRAIANERNDDTWDLVELTGMRPLGVVLGLLWASLVQTMLYTAALAPFMVMAYLLRGIDVFAVVFTLILVPLTSIAACSLAVFTAALSAHKAVRATLGGLLGLGLVISWLVTSPMWFNLYFLGQILEELRTFSSEAWMAVAGFFNGWLAGVVLLLVLAGTLLSHRARDRSFAPRALWWCLWANAWIWVAVVLTAVPSIDASDVAEVIIVMAVLTAIHAQILGFFAVSEDRELSPRQARAITDPPRWRRYLTWCLGPGAARGRLGYLAMTVLSLGAGFAAWGSLGFATRHRYTDVGEIFALAWSIAAWGAIILLISETIARGMWRHWFDTAVLRRGFTLLVIAALSLIPPLVAWMLGSEIKDSWTSFLSPITTFVQVADTGLDDVIIPFAFFTAVGLFAHLVLLIQGLRLNIVTARVLARDEDHNPRGG